MDRILAIFELFAAAGHPKAGLVSNLFECSKFMHGLNQV